MLNAENQTAYILVDKWGNGGMGSVVGLLKVGRKKLFLLDEAGKPNELVPQRGFWLLCGGEEAAVWLWEEVWEHAYGGAGRA